jgi:hypothetical protein
MIIQSKINDTKDIMKRKAMEIDKHKMDVKRSMPAGPGYNPAMGGMGGGGMGSSSSSMSRPIGMDMDAGAAMWYYNASGISGLSSLHVYCGFPNCGTCIAWTQAVFAAHLRVAWPSRQLQVAVWLMCSSLDVLLVSAGEFRACLLCCTYLHTCTTRCTDATDATYVCCCCRPLARHARPRQRRQLWRQWWRQRQHSCICTKIWPSQEGHAAGQGQGRQQHPGEPGKRGGRGELGRAVTAVSGCGRCACGHADHLRCFGGRGGGGREGSAWLAMGAGQGSCVHRASAISRCDTGYETWQLEDSTRNQKLSSHTACAVMLSRCPVCRACVHWR